MHQTGADPRRARFLIPDRAGHRIGGDKADALNRVDEGVGVFLNTLRRFGSPGGQDATYHLPAHLSAAQQLFEGQVHGFVPLVHTQERGDLPGPGQGQSVDLGRDALRIVLAHAQLSSPYVSTRRREIAGPIQRHCSLK